MKLPFDGHQRVITIRRIYITNEDIVESMNYGFIVIRIKWKNNKGLAQCIDQLKIKTVRVITERSKCITYNSDKIFIQSINYK